ncbi:sulfurtransferase TusA family protein [Achromobacter sp. F4_2707]|uniref:sulfurtransferase TusA family protein n=1 Tax=Achromobacter sp. F4_2707 TaxID=3114286 RepID=UPI0039C6EEE5
MTAQSGTSGDLPVAATEVDASGLKCPLPILRAKKALAQMESGAVLKVITTDPHAERDFQAFCKQTGNELLAQAGQGDAVWHFLRRR